MTYWQLEQLRREWEWAKQEKGPHNPVTWELRRQYLLAQAEYREKEQRATESNGLTRER